MGIIQPPCFTMALRFHSDFSKNMLKICSMFTVFLHTAVGLHFGCVHRLWRAVVRRSNLNYTPSLLVLVSESFCVVLCVDIILASFFSICLTFVCLLFCRFVMSVCQFFFFVLYL